MEKVLIWTQTARIRFQPQAIITIVRFEERKGLASGWPGDSCKGHARQPNVRGCQSWRARADWRDYQDRRRQSDSPRLRGDRRDSSRGGWRANRQTLVRWARTKGHRADLWWDS